MQRHSPAFCGIPGLSSSHSPSFANSSTSACQPSVYQMLRRKRKPNSDMPQSTARTSRSRIACQQTPQPPSSNKILAYAAAAILAATPFIPLSSPPPAIASPINSAPLRFQQSLLLEDAGAPVKLQPQWDVKSINSQIETFLMFSNDSGSVVDLWWIDYFGHEVYYASINPGTTHMQPSYATHPWVVRDHISQNSVLVLVAGTQPAMAIVESV